MRTKNILYRRCIILLVLSLPTNLQAGEALIAVASNFTTAAKVLAADFEQREGHRLQLSFGSTGKLYTQIYNGAPFDAYLAADEQRPTRAEEEGLAIPGSRFTYALGRLVLWSAGAIPAAQLADYLRQDRYQRLALANPKIAPYGMASQEVIERMGLNPSRQKLAYGENILQTYQFVVTGNADLGFVALAQLAQQPGESFWLVPEYLYQPIRQQAVLLKRGQNSPAAVAFLSYLQADSAQAIIRQYGYGRE